MKNILKIYMKYLRVIYLNSLKIYKNILTKKTENSEIKFIQKFENILKQELKLTSECLTLINL